MSSSPAPIRPSLGYRAEIDGLRAIAVLTVVLFHAKIGVLTGGYAGVDVFFVISGFLISRLIAQEWEREGRFSLAGFYERRIRRLFPALLAMVLTSLALGWRFLPPIELEQLARSAFAALAFFSNLHFAKTAGYFQPRAESQPLLHTWSLGVEEQFYILAPFVILALVRLSPGLRRGLLLGLAVASLGGAMFLALRQSDAAFYWPHTRAYELLIGVALGLGVAPLPQGEGARARLALAGLGIMALALLALPPGIAFPSFWALIPCLGTAMVLAATEGGAVPGLAGSLLRAAPMRFFGQISYSLYLWHWPLLVYAELAGEGAPAPVLRAVAIAAAIGLAWFSWRFIETPIRHGRAKSRLLQVFAPVALVLAAGWGASVLATKRGGFPERLGAFAAPLKAMNEPAATVAACGEGRGCRFGVEGAPLKLILWGDSHIGMILPIADRVAKTRQVQGEAVFAGGCPPLIDASSRAALDRPKCRESVRRALALVEANPGARVVLVGRWALYAEGSRYGEDEQGQQARSIAEGAVASRKAFAESLAATLAKLAGLKAEVRVIGPVAEFPFDVLQRASRSLMHKQMPDLSLPQQAFEARQGGVFATLKAAGVPVILPHAGLCDGARCLATKDGVPLYGDSNHLTARGISLIAPIVEKALE